ncbi:hypothetical protein LTR94_032629, partial [Friedmanniomyces endolithicus]
GGAARIADRRRRPAAGGCRAGRRSLRHRAALAPPAGNQRRGGDRPRQQRQCRHPTAHDRNRHRRSDAGCGRTRPRRDRRVAGGTGVRARAAGRGGDADPPVAGRRPLPRQPPQHGVRDAGGRAGVPVPRLAHPPRRDAGPPLVRGRAARRCGG